MASQADCLPAAQEQCSPRTVATIRAAASGDLPRLLEMGLRFRKESRYAEFLAENPDKMLALGELLIDKDGYLLSERDGKITGMLGYILHDHFISGEKVAGEVFWWVEPEYRGDGLRLLREAERRAKAAGASYMHMIAPTKQVATIYGRLGYEYVEETHQKSL